MSSSILLKTETQIINANLTITGSKSESNRLLILNALYNNPFSIMNLSNAEDTTLLKKALATKDSLLDIHHAGTAMRFLTAFFAIQEGKEIMITGSPRMKERPIAFLVEALQTLGADIVYEENKGFPPLRIKGKHITTDAITIAANVSSQYITALMLIAPKLTNGLTINLVGKITSRPYLEMTVELLQSVGVQVSWQDTTIKIQPKTTIAPQQFVVESDWSSASYHYSIAAIATQATITLNHYKPKSLQGDAALAEIYIKNFGVETLFQHNTIVLTKQKDFIPPNHINLDLNQCPDIAQTIAVTAAAIGVKCKLTGLETLKVKETDRLVALQNELEKIGAKTIIDHKSLEIITFTNKQELPKIKTYNDHRMAMAFAPLALKFPIEIENPTVVEKSYPGFWDDLSTMNIK